MVKTNAERQREYRERKKANEGQKYLPKERARQQKNYKKVKDLSKKELRKRRETVKLQVQKHRCNTKKLLEASKCDTSLTINSSTTSSPEPAFLVAINFPKRGESSRKRKRRSINLSSMQQQKQAAIGENCVDPSLRFLILKRTNVVSTRMFTSKSLNFMLGMPSLEKRMLKK